MPVKSETFLSVFGVAVAILLRCSTSLHSYSGQGKPPMYGDYEAQRHWMEITVNLPIREWYHNTSLNDLQYWGLDYPPLTAYHSYLCGLVAYVINTDYVALTQSRGYESEDHKLFMRYTVLLVDVVIFLPAVFFYFYKVRMGVTPVFGIIATILYPGLILIDHGHFQYNCVSLALALYAITFIHLRKHLLASIFFSLALNYKQMELYHSLPFFTYLLSTCIPQPGQSAIVGVRKLFNISLTVITTFAIIWLPFLDDVSNTKQVLNRLFPVARGVFEDKVANFWCALNVFYKFKSVGNTQMFRLCTIATLVAVLPSCLDVFLRPNVKKFVLALINSSLAFFLFSFQVHEKTILLAALPVMLYLPVDPLGCFWFLLISIFSMLPLILKDELFVAFFALTVFYVITFHLLWEHVPLKGHAYKVFVPRYDKIVNLCGDLQKSTDYADLYTNFYNNSEVLYDICKFVIVCFSLLGCVVITIITLLLQPPEMFPDIFSLLISVYSCGHFLGFFLYFNIVQFQIPQAAEDIKHFKFKTD